ncbi:unnamed protein product [Closterium sp. Naga37s-1]|nr:unnamed protein product [Closterium sp. Naga37s-1]
MTISRPRSSFNTSPVAKSPLCPPLFTSPPPLLSYSVSFTAAKLHLSSSPITCHDLLGAWWRWSMLAAVLPWATVAMRLPRSPLSTIQPLYFRCAPFSSFSGEQSAGGRAAQRWLQQHGSQHQSTSVNASQRQSLKPTPMPSLPLWEALKEHHQCVATCRVGRSVCGGMHKPAANQSHATCNRRCVDDGDEPYGALLLAAVAREEFCCPALGDSLSASTLLLANRVQVAEPHSAGCSSMAVNISQRQSSKPTPMPSLPLWEALKEHHQCVATCRVGRSVCGGMHKPAANQSHATCNRRCVDDGDEPYGTLLLAAVAREDFCCPALGDSLSASTLLLHFLLFLVLLPCPYAFSLSSRPHNAPEQRRPTLTTGGVHPLCLSLPSAPRPPFFSPSLSPSVAFALDKFHDASIFWRMVVVVHGAMAAELMQSAVYSGAPPSQQGECTRSVCDLHSGAFCVRCVHKIAANQSHATCIWSGGDDLHGTLLLTAVALKDFCCLGRLTLCVHASPVAKSPLRTPSSLLFSFAIPICRFRSGKISRCIHLLAHGGGGPWCYGSRAHAECSVVGAVGEISGEGVHSCHARVPLYPSPPSLAQLAACSLFTASALLPCHLGVLAAPIRFKANRVQVAEPHSAGCSSMAVNISQRQSSKPTPMPSLPLWEALKEHHPCVATCRVGRSVCGGMHKPAANQSHATCNRRCVDDGDEPYGTLLLAAVAREDFCCPALSDSLSASTLLLPPSLAQLAAVLPWATVAMRLPRSPPPRFNHSIFAVLPFQVSQCSLFTASALLPCHLGVLAAPIRFKANRVQVAEPHSAGCSSMAVNISQRQSTPVLETHAHAIAAIMIPLAFALPAALFQFCFIPGLEALKEHHQCVATCRVGRSVCGGMHKSAANQSHATCNRRCVDDGDEPYGMLLLAAVAREDFCCPALGDSLSASMLLLANRVQVAEPHSAGCSSMAVNISQRQSSKPTPMPSLPLWEALKEHHPCVATCRVGRSVCGGMHKPAANQSHATCNRRCVDDGDEPYGTLLLAAVAREDFCCPALGNSLSASTLLLSGAPPSQQGECTRSVCDLHSGAFCVRCVHKIAANQSHATCIWSGGDDLRGTLLLTAVALKDFCCLGRLTLCVHASPVAKSPLRTPSSLLFSFAIPICRFRSGQISRCIHLLAHGGGGPCPPSLAQLAAVLPWATVAMRLPRSPPSTIQPLYFRCAPFSSFSGEQSAGGRAAQRWLQQHGSQHQSTPVLETHAHAIADILGEWVQAAQQHSAACSSTAVGISQRQSIPVLDNAAIAAVMSSGAPPSQQGECTRSVCDLHSGAFCVRCVHKIAANQSHATCIWSGGDDLRGTLLLTAVALKDFCCLGRLTLCVHASPVAKSPLRTPSSLLFSFAIPICRFRSGKISRCIHLLVHGGGGPWCYGSRAHAECSVVGAVGEISGEGVHSCHARVPLYPSPPSLAQLAAVLPWATVAMRLPRSPPSTIQPLYFRCAPFSSFSVLALHCFCSIATFTVDMRLPHPTTSQTTLAC